LPEDMASADNDTVNEQYRQYVSGSRAVNCQRLPVPLSKLPENLASARNDMPIDQQCQYVPGTARSDAGAYQLRSLTPLATPAVATVNTMDQLVARRNQALEHARQRQEEMDSEVARIEQQREVELAMAAARNQPAPADSAGNACHMLSMPGGNGVEQMRCQVAMSPTAAEMWQERQRHNEALERMRHEYEEKMKAKEVESETRFRELVNVVEQKLSEKRYTPMPEQVGYGTQSWPATHYPDHRENVMNPARTVAGNVATNVVSPYQQSGGICRLGIAVRFARYHLKIRNATHQLTVVASCHPPPLNC
jgi:hypothetical protein